MAHFSIVQGSQSSPVKTKELNVLGFYSQCYQSRTMSYLQYAPLQQSAPTTKKYILQQIRQSQ